MKTKLIFALCIIVLVLFDFKILAQNSWSMIAPYPPKIGAYSSVTIGNKAYFWCPNNIVFSTADAADTIIVYPPYGPVGDIVGGSNQGIAFADSLIGYVTDPAHGQFRTTDGGFTWKQMEPPGANIERVVFGNSKVGWKFGVGGTYRTTDAGATWNFVNTPYAFAGIFSKAFALDENRVWLATSYSSSAKTGGAIWSSTNSGISWAQVDSAPMSDTNTKISYSDLKYNPSGLGIAIGTKQTGNDTLISFVSRTTDLGNTWTTTEFKTETPKTVLSIGDSIWIILGAGSNTYMRRSMDSGKTWAYSTNIFPGQYNDFATAAYIQDSKIIVAATRFSIYKSNDSGLTFNKITSTRDITISGISLDNKPLETSEHLVAAWSYTNKFLVSQDAGKTWTQENLPGNYYNSFLQMSIAEGVIYTIPDQERLYKSTDSGKSWQQIHLPYYNGSRALYAYDKNNLVVQLYKNILYSSNGGSSWNQTPFPGNCWLNESSMPAPATIIGGGGYYDSTSIRGIIYRSTDSGHDWQIIDFPREINHISMITNTTGYACSNYEFYKTTNGGQNWNKILSSSDYFTHYDAFFFEDSLKGLLRISFNFVETTDGGLTWHTKLLAAPMYSISDVAETNTGNLLVAGDGMLWELLAYSVGKVTEISKDFKKKNYLLPLELDVYPNPFNPSTSISFLLNSYSHVRVSVYDILGRNVAEPLNKELQPGHYSIMFDGSLLATGIYIFYLQTQYGTAIKKALLIK